MCWRAGITGSTGSSHSSGVLFSWWALPSSYTGVAWKKFCLWAPQKLTNRATSLNWHLFSKNFVLLMIFPWTLLLLWTVELLFTFHSLTTPTFYSCSSCPLILLMSYILRSEINTPWYSILWHNCARELLDPGSRVNSVWATVWPLCLIQPVSCEFHSGRYSRFEFRHSSAKELSCPDAQDFLGLLFRIWTLDHIKITCQSPDFMQITPPEKALRTTRKPFPGYLVT